MQERPSTCNPCLWSRSQNEAAFLDGFIGKGEVGLAQTTLFLKRAFEKLHQKGKEKNPKGKGISEKNSKYKKRKMFQSLSQAGLQSCYQAVLYHGSNPGLLTAPLKLVSDHISLNVMLWQCVMTGMQRCCGTHAVVHRLIFPCAALCAVVFILTCMTFKKNLSV